MNILFRNSRRKLSQGVLFWREVGNGIPVVFLHGAWNDGSEWVSTMELLAEGIHCFALDLLGFGESANPDIHHSIDLQVECLADFLEALKLEKVYLVGNSLGGWIAASYALKYPEQIYGLILLAPEGVAAEGQKQYWEKRRRLFNLSPLIIKFLRLITPLIKLIGWEEKITKDLELRKTLLDYPTASHLLFNRKTPEIEAEFLEKHLPNMKVPCLILQGSQDTTVAISRSNTYAQLIPNVKLHNITHGESNLPESRPGVVAEAIWYFINQ
ncbi:alpha/beta hydrolase [Dolichospermum sp. FACHB-1091]|uniref:alpha/beta fold hydrolase n=1 Tax=Dolichospermum sp. FACHB-1091 TaxID=2692798 RepID=UPI0016801E50|nr:alpha/beta hydrolase [Dolichospermum sp. FACHB-1091]MBD2441824.1 alpha/beta hydrolase [Dolichospermum sp. FACHB-1091]